MISKFRLLPKSLACAPALALLTFLAGASGPTALAAQEASSWNEDHASRARLVAGGQRGDARIVGLEIVLDEGYKTYWRHPGDSGLPPEIDWAGSDNVADVEVLFPAPGRFKDASGVFFGYSKQVILPLLVTPVDPARPISLAVSLDYGVCKEICIPARAELELAPPAGQKSAHAEAVAASVARVPVEREVGAAGDLAVTGVEVGASGDLMVSVRAPKDALLFAEGPNYSWFLAPEAAMQPGGEPGTGTFTVELADRPAVVAEPVRLVFTLTAAGQAIESSVELPPQNFPPRKNPPG